MPRQEPRCRRVYSDNIHETGKMKNDSEVKKETSSPTSVEIIESMHALF